MDRLSPCEAKKRVLPLTPSCVCLSVPGSVPRSTPPPPPHATPPSLTVDEHDVREARLGQGRRHVPHDRHERRRPQGHRSREGLVVVGHAVVYARSEEGASGLGNTASDGLLVDVRYHCCII